MVGEKVACTYCRNKYSPFNVKKHEEACAMNPSNGGVPVTNQEESISESPAAKIRNVNFLPNTGLVACFNSQDNTAIEVPINFFGTLELGDEENVSLLVVTSDGLIQAPILIEGFVGIKEKSNIESTKEEVEEDTSLEVTVPVKDPLSTETDLSVIAGRIKEAEEQK